MISCSQSIRTYKSGGVVIPRSLGIAKSLQNRIGLYDLILKRDLGGIFLLALPSPDHGEVGDDFLGVLRLACSRLAPALETYSGSETFKPNTNLATYVTRMD